jgi:hypothetical protein
MNEENRKEQVRKELQEDIRKMKETTTCKDCGREVKEEENFCSFCGASDPAHGFSSEMHKIAAVAGVLGFLLLIVVATVSITEKDTRPENPNQEDIKKEVSPTNHGVDGLGISLSDIRRAIILKNGFHPEDGPYQNRGESLAPPVTTRTFARNSSAVSDDDILLIGDSKDLLLLKLSLRDIFRDREKVLDSLQMVNTIADLIGYQGKYIGVDQYTNLPLRKIKKQLIGLEEGKETADSLIELEIYKVKSVDTPYVKLVLTARSNELIDYQRNH